MQKFLLNLFGLALVSSLVLFSSCEDTPSGDSALGPDVQLVADLGFIDGDSDVLIGESFEVKIRIFTGDAKLQSVEIKEGADKLASSRFTINAGAITSNNPFLITGADKDGATYEFRINPGTEAVGDLTTYTFTVTDDAGETDAIDVIITTTEPAGTATEMTITGVLLNQAGPAGTGGLDLDTGTGTGSADASAEIRDLGINCTISTGTENWRGLFGTVNGADMVRVDHSQVENFTFESADTKEAILAAYSSGIALADGFSQAPNCDQVTVTDATDATTVGDLFVVSSGGTYYLLKIDEINMVLGSDSSEHDNTDNFVFSIKY